MVEDTSRNVYILVRPPEGKRTLGRPKRRREGDITWTLKKAGKCGVLTWVKKGNSDGAL